MAAPLDKTTQAADALDHRYTHGDGGEDGPWIGVQEKCRAGEPGDVFPYPEEIRFCRRFPRACRRLSEVAAPGS